MSVRCPDCGAVASYGREIGHKSDCPSLASKQVEKSALGAEISNRNDEQITHQEGNS